MNVDAFNEIGKPMHQRDVSCEPVLLPGTILTYRIAAGPFKKRAGKTARFISRLLAF